VQDDSLVLGKTTRSDIIARLGPPYRESAVIKNEKQIKTASYTRTGEAGDDGIIPSRSEGFYFYDDKLVGYEYTSSWKGDSTDFDKSKVSQIKRGVSTRADVVQLLGPPGGRHIYPLVAKPDEDGVSYLYGQTRNSLFAPITFYQKQLLITFNKQGIVIDMQYAERGQR